MITKIFRYIVDFIKHKSCGSPQSSQEEIDKKYNICRICPSFKVYEQKAETDGECIECGCGISKNGYYFNMLAWEDKKCPLNKW